VLTFTDEQQRQIQLEPDVFIIAGYTGRDRAMVQKHIDELAHEGIPAPPEVPMWYEMPVGILTQAKSINVPTKETCGEVEPILIGVGNDLYLGLGSDHTARDVERESISKSKSICPKPVGANVVCIGTPDAALDAIDGEAYQRGAFAQIMPLATLLGGLRERKGNANFVLFCGTVPLLTHGFRFGKKFAARISGGPLAHPLTLEYSVE
jgi:hypothetical protein